MTSQSADLSNHKRAITPLGASTKFYLTIIENNSKILVHDSHIQCGYQQLLDESKTIRKENELLRKKVPSNFFN